MDKNILKKLKEKTLGMGDKPLLIIDERSYTYSEFDELTQVFMAAILDSGYKRGDNVAIIIEEFDWFYAALFAAWRVGAVAVPLNASLGASDLQMLVEKGKCTLLLTTDSFIEKIECKEKISANTLAFDKKAAVAEHKELDDDETAVIMFTSGTTGIPKGVVQNLYSQSENAYLTCQRLALNENDRVFINTPPYFTSGLCHFTTLIYAGGSLVGHKGFVFGADLLTKMEETGATGFGGAPAHLVRVVETMQEPYTDKSINFWMSSGDHLPKSVIEKARIMLPNVRLFNVYGLTEVSGRLCILQPEFSIEKHGSVGTPIGDMKVTVLDADGNIAKDGEIGEINVMGSLLLKEYLDAPDITAKAIGEYGFRTGDFGYKDEDGFVFIEGRRDDIFKRGGEKVSTNKIKQAMLTLDIFKDVAVVAKDDEMMGKVPVACVVLKEGVKLSKYKVLKSLKDKLPATYIPANIVAMDEIPRTGSGKAKLKELRQLLDD